MCSRCGSTDIKLKRVFNVTSNDSYQLFSCKNCKYSWRQVHGLKKEGGSNETKIKEKCHDTQNHYR